MKPRRRMEDLGPTDIAILAALGQLAEYVLRGYPVEFFDPEPRGRKGRDHNDRRTVRFTVHDVAVFDDIGWRRMQERWRRRTPRRTPTADRGDG